WKGWAILLRQKQKKLIMLPSETMIWQPEFTDKTLSRKPGAVHIEQRKSEAKVSLKFFLQREIGQNIFTRVIKLKLVKTILRI
ncbi:hypothetical protein, partial [Escherichia coli]|uniref:hypothetical protein n=1 Tax=Escherichia coli TaxID=562 RepID=UPI001BE423DE